jgi:hypothetical protein
MTTTETDAQATDPNPWFCNLCGRMSSPAHIGPLHALPLWNARAETVYKPRTPEQVAENAEERDRMTVSAMNHPTIRGY